MAGFGAIYINFAPFDGAEPIDALPKYGEKVSLGALVQADLTVETASGEIYADDVLNERLEVFARGALAVQTADLGLDTGKVIYGTTTTATGEEVVNSIEDNIPFGGITYIKKLLRAGKYVYRGIYHPKVKAGFGSDSAQTRGSSITFTTQQTPFTVYAANTGAWRVQQEFENEAAAKAWCDEKIAKATA